MDWWVDHFQTYTAPLMVPRSRESQVPYLQTALAGAVLMLLGLFLPWLSAGAGGETELYGGFAFPAVWVPTSLCVVLVCGFALTWWRLKDDRLQQYAALCAGFLLLYLVATLVVIESFSDLLPTSFLPAVALRRSSSLLAAGIGLWTSLAGVGVVILAAGGDRVWEAGRRAWRSSGGPEKVLAAGLLGILALVVGWLRCQPWIDSSVFGSGITLSAQAAPYVGPASLLVVALLVCSLVLAGMSLFQPAGLVAAGAGWLLTFLAAIAVIGSETLARLRLGDLISGSQAGHSVTFQATAAAWSTYATGLVIALIGGFLVCWKNQSGEG